MDLGFGGPVWHASVAVHRFRFPDPAKQFAEQALAGVGDAALGEWHEASPMAYHIRRRLSVAEALERGLVVTDMRGTAAGAVRLEKLFAQHPQLLPHAQRAGEV